MAKSNRKNNVMTSISNPGMGVPQIVKLKLIMNVFMMELNQIALNVILRIAVNAH
jgi:hypothetical protein